MQELLRSKFKTPSETSSNAEFSNAIINLLTNEKEIRSLITNGEGVKKQQLTLLLCDLCKPRRMDDFVSTWWRTAKLATHRIHRVEHFIEPYEENTKEFAALLSTEKNDTNAELLMSTDRFKAFFARPEMKVTCKTVLAMLKRHCTEGLLPGMLTRAGYDEHRTLLRLAPPSSSTIEKKRKREETEETSTNKKAKTNENVLSQLCIERICTREGQAIRQHQSIIKQVEFLLRTPRIRALVTQDGGMTKGIVSKIIADVLNVRLHKSSAGAWWDAAGLTWIERGNFHYLQEPSQGKEPLVSGGENDLRKLLDNIEKSTKQDVLFQSIRMRFEQHFNSLCDAVLWDGEVRQTWAKECGMNKSDMESVLQRMLTHIMQQEKTWITKPQPPIFVELQSIMKAYIEKDEKKRVRKRLSPF